MTDGRPATAGGPLIVDVAGAALDASDRALLAEPAVGGAILFTRNFRDRAQLAELVRDMRAARPGLLVVADYEGGRVQRFVDGFTRIPPMARLGQRYRDDPAAGRDAARELGWLVATELAEVGVDLPLAPVADRDYGHSSVIGHRAFSDRPADVAELAIAYMSGLAAGGSAATAKHFPGHGWVSADSHAELPVDSRAEPALAADWAPFAKLVDAGLASIMMAHVRYPAIDAAPASLSRVWIEDILRRRLGFTGCVFCDDLSMGGAAAVGDYPARIRTAQRAGCDYLPVCNDRAGALAAVAALGENLPPGQAQRAALHAVLARHRRQAEPASAARLANARALAKALSNG